MGEELACKACGYIATSVDYIYLKITRKTKEEIDYVASEEPAKDQTYSIKSMMPSIVGPAIV